MSPYLERIVERLRDAEDDLAHEVEEQQQRWHYRVQRGRVWFDKEVRHAHRRRSRASPRTSAKGVCSARHCSCHLFVAAAATGARRVGVDLPVDLLSDLPHRARASRGLLRDRPTQARVFERNREGQLYVLQLREWSAGGTCARWRLAPNNTGARSSTRARFRRHTRDITCFSTTATLKGIDAASWPCVGRCRKEGIMTVGATGFDANAIANPDRTSSHHRARWISGGMTESQTSEIR